MKKILLSVLALLAFAGTGTAQNLPSYVPADGLVGWWPFNGNANDESGNGNNGTANSATLTTDRKGVPQNAYEINNFKGGISVNNMPPIDSVYTFSIWSSLNMPIGAMAVMMSNDWGNCGEFVLYHETDATVRFGTKNSCTSNIECFNSQPITNNIWVHHIAVRKMDSIFLYTNGDLSAKEKNINILPNQLQTFYFGGDPTSGGLFNGKIDDIAIYNRALSQQEITALYQGGNTTANCLDLPSNLQQGLVGYWPFCGNANDESGNGNNGTVNGATLTSDRFGNAGSAYDFDGSNNYISIQHSESFNFSTHSISIWYKKINPATSTQILVSKGTDIAFGSLVFWQGPNAESYNINGNTSSTGNIAGNQVTGAWENRTMIYDSASHTMKLYRNGTLMNTNTEVAPYSQENSDPFTFGVHSTFLSGPFAYFYSGTLDDIAIWNRALSQSEITQLYLAGNDSSLLYQLSQEKLGNCSNSPVRLSVKTQVRIRTDSVSGIGGNSAVAYAKILNNGGKTITRRGLCWSTSPSPTLSNFFSENGSGSGAFSGSFSNLFAFTTYYLRAYAGTDTEVWYGNEISFIPSSLPGTITDSCGNTYQTLQIGNQVWMKQNLKVCKYRNGDPIPGDLSPESWASTTSGAFDRNYFANYDTIYGKQYNWFAVSDPRGLCPAGWHVPAKAEWNVLTKFLDPDADTSCVGSSCTNVTGGKMKKGEAGQPLNGGWSPPNLGASDSSGFTAIPGGLHSAGLTNYYQQIGRNAYFWSSTSNAACCSWYAGLNTFNAVLERSVADKRFGYSVRCIKD